MGKPTISETGKRQLQLLLVGGGDRDFADLCQLLEKANHGQVHFEHATSLEDSINQLRQRSYDLLLCSDHSTDNVAFQLLRQMRQHYSGIPIIFLSDPVNQEVSETAIQTAGCHGAGQGNRLETSPEFAAAIDAHSAERHQEPDETLRKL
jgi:CheY-like chemotaxis protein